MFIMAVISLPSAYSSPEENMTVGLCGWWTLDSGSWVDSSGHGLTLTEEGTVDVAPGLIGNASDYDGGATDSLVLTDNRLVNTSVEFTTGCWFNPDSIGRNSGIISKFQDPPGWNIYAGTDNAYHWYSNSGGGNTATTSTVKVGIWSLVIGRHYGSTCTLHFNNTLEGTDSSCTFTSTMFDFEIGNRADTALPADGQLDECFFYNRSLTQGEIDWLYNGGAGRTFSDLPVPASITVSWSGYTPLNSSPIYVNNTGYEDMRYNLTGSGAEYCELWGSGSLVANSSSPVAVGTVPSLNATLADGTYNLSISCYNSSANNGHSTVKWLRFDSVHPSITWSSPLSDNTTAIDGYVSNQSLISVVFTDDHLFNYNVTVTDSVGTVMYTSYQEGLNVTSYNLTYSGLYLNTSGTYYVYAHSCDSHTGISIQDIPLRSTGKGLELPGKFMLEPEDSSKILSMSSSKEHDRYVFIFSYAEKLSYVRYRLTGLYLFHLGDSGYKGHFVIDGRYWLDFEGEGVSSVDVEENVKGSDYTVTVYYSTPVSNAVSRSLGELNCNDDWLSFTRSYTVPAVEDYAFDDFSCSPSDTPTALVFIGILFFVGMVWIAGLWSRIAILNIGIGIVMFFSMWQYAGCIRLLNVLFVVMGFTSVIYGVICARE